MDEIKFILKSLVVTIVILFVLQIKIGQSTLEAESLHWIQTSSTTRYLQNVAVGATLAIRNASQSASDFVAKTFNQGDTNRASRFNLDLKRSPQVNRTQHQNQ